MYEWGLERFIAEAKTLAQFRHPNIVQVVSVFEANNTAYMVTGYESGRCFSDVLGPVDLW
jgi:serine/threonine protein kinase